MVKKIIPLILASSIVFSCIAPASAADTPTTGEIVNSIVQETLGSSMFNFAVIGISTGVGTYFGQPQAGAFLGGVLADGIEKYADYLAAGYTDQDIYDQFTNYNAQLETDLGTATLLDGGIRVYLSTNNITSNYATVENKVYGTTPSFTFAQSGYNYGPQVKVKFDGIPLPFSCNWRAGYSYTASSDNVIVDGPSNVLYEGWRAGQTPTGPTLTFGISQWNSNWYSVQCACFFDLYPASGSVSTSVDISAPSRPTSLVTPLQSKTPTKPTPSITTSPSSMRATK